MTAVWARASARLTNAEVLTLLAAKKYVAAAHFDPAWMDTQRRLGGVLQELGYNRGLFDTTLGTNGAWDDTFGWFRSVLRRSGEYKKPWEVYDELAADYAADPVNFLAAYFGQQRAEQLVVDVWIESTDTTTLMVRAAATEGVHVTSDEGLLFDIDGGIGHLNWTGQYMGYVTADATLPNVSVTSLTGAELTGRQGFFGMEENTRWPNILRLDDDGGFLRVTAGHVTIAFTGGSGVVAAGSVIVGAISGATAIMLSTTSQTAGTLTLVNWNGINFTNGETIDETSGTGDWSATYTAATQATVAGNIDHYRAADRVLLINTAVTSYISCQVATITSMDAGNDRFTVDVAYAARKTNATKVANTFFASWGVATALSTGSPWELGDYDFAEAPRQNQIVAFWGGSGGLTVTEIAANLLAMPAGHRVLRSVDVFSIPYGVGNKARYGDRASFGSGALKFDQHSTYITPLAADFFADLKTACDAAGATLDFFFGDVEMGAHGQFWVNDGAKAEIDTELATTDVGFDIDVDDWTGQDGSETPAIGAPETVAAGKRRDWAITAAMSREQQNYTEEIQDALTASFPNASLLNFRNGPRLPWIGCSPAARTPAASVLHPGGGRFVNEGQAPMRLPAPDEGVSGTALLDIRNMQFYVPTGSDGDDAELTWLQIEVLVSRLQEMIHASRRGVGMFFYEKGDSQISYLGGDRYEDAVMLCLMGNTLQTVCYENAGSGATRDDPLQAALVEFNEAIPYATRLPVPLEYPSGDIFGNDWAQMCVDAGGRWTWYVLPKPGAGVVIAADGADVLINATRLANATIITPTNQVTTGSWITQTAATAVVSDEYLRVNVNVDVTIPRGAAGDQTPVIKSTVSYGGYQRA